MPAVPQVGEADHDVVATIIPPDKLAAQSRAANARDAESRDLGNNLTNQPRQPEIISDASIPRSEHFNSMAEKLKSAMREVNNPSAAVAPSSPPSTTPPANDAKSPADSTASKATAALTPQAQTTATAHDDELPFTKAKAEDWKKLKGSLNEWRNKAQETEKKVLETEKALLEYKAKAVPKDQFEEISKQAQAHKEAAEKLTDKLKLVALEQSEEFGGFYQKQFDSALDRIKESAGDHAELLESLAKSPTSKWRKEKLQEIVSQLPDIDRASASLALAEYDRVAGDKANQLKNWKENYERLIARRDMESKQAQELSVMKENALLKELVSDLGQEDNEFKLTDSDEAHNAKVQHRLAIADKFYRGQLERSQMQEILRTALKHDPEHIKALQAELAQAKETIASYQTANPSASGASARQVNRPTSAAAPAGERRPFLDRFMSVLGQEQG